MEKLERAKSAASHSIPDGDLRKVLERGLDMILAAAAKQHDPKSVRARTAPRHPGPLGRRIPRALVRQVWERDGHCCSWKTAKGISGSKWRLEIDHIVPLALGGKTELANLRLVCREHNQVAARNVFGDAFIAAKIAARTEARELDAGGGASRGSPRAAVFLSASIGA